MGVFLAAAGGGCPTLFFGGAAGGEGFGLGTNHGFFFFFFFLFFFLLKGLFIPRAFEFSGPLRTLGLTVILSDGDVVFQPRKIQRSGLWSAVDGRVLIYIHKERMLDAVAALFPARRYVVVDDKLRILAAIKEIWADRVITIFPRQGHYALDAKNISAYPAADLTVERIGDLLDSDLPALLRGTRTGAGA